VLANWPDARKDIRGWVEKGRTDLLSALTHGIKVHVQSLGEMDASDCGVLEQVLKELPADLAEGLRDHLAEVADGMPVAFAPEVLANWPDARKDIRGGDPGRPRPVAGG